MTHAGVKRLLAGLALALACGLEAPPAAHAQQPSEPRRIGILDPGWAPASPATEPIMRELAARGWIEGQNLIVERRYAEGRNHRLQSLAGELVAGKVEVLVPIGASAARAARQATAVMPIVFVAVPSPARVLPVQSFAKPGGNATGSSFDLPQSEFARLPGLLNEVAPHVFRQGVMWDSTAISTQAEVAAYYALEGARLNFRAFDIRSGADLDEAFDKFRKERVRAVMVLSSPAILAQLPRIVDYMTKNRLPAIYTDRAFVDAGGLMTYGPSMADAERQSAEMLDRVLRGAAPGDLPIQTPARFQPVVNLRAARAIGLVLPQSLLDRSEKIGE